METNFESIQILSESADWICVHKPALMLSVPSRDLKEAKPVLGLILQKQLGYQIYPVHRLDYEVSGLLIFAKNKKYQSVLNIEFENHTAQKSYVALTSQPTSEMPSPQAQKNFDQVYEKLPQNFETVSEFNWTCNLVRGKRRAFEAEYGKQAITTAKCIGTWIKAQRSESEHQNKHQNKHQILSSIEGYFSRFLHSPEVEQKVFAWLLSPRTGRSHQLRYEMYRHGCPILGDELYGYHSKTEARLPEARLPEARLPEARFKGIALCHFQIELKSLGVLKLF